MIRTIFEYFKEFKDYEQCYTVLGAMVKLRCSRVCKEGGGPPFCKIRKCCEKKNKIIEAVIIFLFIRIGGSVISIMLNI